MALVAPSLKGLQSLLKVCEDFCLDWDICLNAKKSKNMYFGKRCSNLCSLQLNGSGIDWVDSWTYLGVSLLSSKRFNCSIDEQVKKF
jgi:hypothetical protein